MTGKTLETELDRWSRQLGGLRQLAREDPRLACAGLTGVLSELHRALEGLRRAGEREVGNGQLPPNAREADGGAGEPGDEPDPEQRFGGSADGSPLLVRVMSTERSCRWANRAWLEFTGRSLEQLVGDGWLQAVHAADRDRCAAHVAGDRGVALPDRLEFRLERKGGGFGRISEIAIPRPAAGTGVSDLVGTAVEIPEREQGEADPGVLDAVTQVLAEADSLEDVGAGTVRALCEGLDWDHGALWVLDADGREAHLVGEWADPRAAALDARSGGSCVGSRRDHAPPPHVGRPIWISDVAAEGIAAVELGVERSEFRGLLRVPVVAGGRIAAFLELRSLEARERDDRVLDRVHAVAAQFGQLVERRRVAERRPAPEALRAARFEAALDPEILVDEGGRVLEFNPAAELVLGYRPDDVRGRELWPLIAAPGLREQFAAASAGFAVTGSSELFGRWIAESLKRADGTEFPVELSVVPLRVAGQRVLAISITDLTSRVGVGRQELRYQERLRSLSAQLLLAEERERRQLAVDLHDGLSQILALIKLGLGRLKREKRADRAKSLAELSALVDQASTTARSVSFELSPPILHDLGLVPALRWLVESLCARYHVDITMDDDGRANPAETDVRVLAFRSIRELLINAAKHADAQSICLRIGLDGERIAVTVADDGVGMDRDEVHVRGSGLFSIEERLKSVGGSMQIDSEPGLGTTIELKLPIVMNRPTEENEAVTE